MRWNKIIFFVLIFAIFTIFTANAEFGPWNTKLVKKEKNKNQTNHTQPVVSTPGWVLIKFIRFFQVVISPQDGPNCRYTPTCSQYALICIRDYGPLIGLIMAADRYMRCNPLGAWGRDLPSENYFWGSSNTNSYNNK